MEPAQALLLPHRHAVGPLPFGGDVGLDHRAHQPVQRFAEGLVILAAGAAVHKDQQITRVELQAAADLFTAVEPVHDLADHIDQDVLVIDRRLPLGAGDHFEPFAVMLIAPDRRFGLFRQHIEGMFHLRDQILQHRICHIANEEIRLRVAVGKQLIQQIRGFRNHAAYSGDQEPGVKQVRGIRNRLFNTPMYAALFRI